MKQYQIESLADLAKLFEQRAEERSSAGYRAATGKTKAVCFAESRVWQAAADIASKSELPPCPNCAYLSPQEG